MPDIHMLTKLIQTQHEQYDNLAFKLNKQIF